MRDCLTETEPAPTGGKVLTIVPSPHLFPARTFSVDREAKPLRQKTRRKGQTVVLQPGPEVGTGLAYRRHVPLTTLIRVNDTDGAPLSSLLDTGASLSVIDRNLLELLRGTVQGQPMRIQGLGPASSLGWSTLTFFIDARSALDGRVTIECSVDFHVLEAFAPGLCLGQDFVSTHGVVIDSAKGAATVDSGDTMLTFSVHEHMPAPFASAAELCVVRDVVVPARSHAWVPVDVACLAPGVDYTVFPRLTVDPSETVQLAGPVAVTARCASHILLTNVGTADAVIERRTPVADALVAHLGDAHVHTSRTFDLSLAEPIVVGVHLADATPASAADVDVSPLDICDDTESSVPPAVPDEPTTVMVDDVFKVGVAADGTPYADVVEVLRRHRAAFALDGRPGRVVGHEMSIELRDAVALHPEAPRRASPEKCRAMDSAIDQLLSWDVIEPSSSPVSFPVLMVRQYEKWRFCVDYRQLNAHTIPDSYPLPTTDSVFNSLMGKKIFSSLDALRGYHQLGVREQDRWKTAFTCHRGLFQYKTVPFGLRNAPAVFQRLMDALLGELRWKDAVVYIDDVVVATHTLAEHVAALDTLLACVSVAGLRFSPAKCTFAVSSLVLLGRKVSGAGMAVWSDRAKAVLDLPRPRTLRDLYHALGLFGYYRAFVPRFATVAAPLSQLIQGWRYDRVGERYQLVGSDGVAASAARVEIPWGDAQQSAFDQLKAAIASPPVLAHPDPTRPYLLYVDASKEGFGAVLHQVFERDDGPGGATMFPLDVHLLPSTVTKERWRAWLLGDRLFGPIVRSLEAGDGTTDDWLVEDGVFVRRVDGVLALPDAGVPFILRAAHDSAGHFGFSKTFLRVRRHFWRPSLSVAVRAWVRHCAACISTKLIRRTGELEIGKDPALPFEAISIDLLLGFPRSRAGNDAVLVVLDLFSRMVLMEPCSSSVTSEAIAAILSDRVLRMGWRPRRLVPDSEARLTGDVMRRLAASLQAELRPSLPHHHQANPVERTIQTAKFVLQSLCVTSRAHWDRRAVPAAELAINSTPSVTTGERPFDLVFVAHPDLVHAVFDSDEHSGVGSFAERLAAADARLSEAREAVSVARVAQKRNYDRSRAALPLLEPGARVYVRLDDRPMPGALHDKLAPRRQGPYEVLEVLSPHRVRLALPEGIGIGNEFDVSQLDVTPAVPDPFETHRAGSPPVSSSSPVPASPASPPEVLPSLPPRERHAPRAMREYETGPGTFSMSVVPVEELRGPYRRPRRLSLEDGREVVLVEKPVAFLSRLTAPAERKLVAAELELCCLAWAFGRFLHLLEGADVTVVTDHAPLGAMLTSTAGAKYGPVISRCRAVLMPHLAHLRFVVCTSSGKLAHQR
ncbi:hypothetical protein A4X06_0g4603 [Tilletia controversa]|uniref:RNA-directed DNA polymerase n=1 Tax=Tilletia controversa TaxID=13291 RepID=A0A8X7MT58_9BASI|nr:hypothetical protein A4X06_0g4603 [Tilletia controversa]